MKKIICILIVVFCSACTIARPVGIVASSSPLSPDTKGTIKTSASNCQYNLFGFIPITSSLNTASALEEAKSDIDVDSLTDIGIDHSHSFYFLFTKNCVRVSGLGVRK